VRRTCKVNVVTVYFSSINICYHEYSLGDDYLDFMVKKEDIKKVKEEGNFLRKWIRKRIFPKKINIKGLKKLKGALKE